MEELQGGIGTTPDLEEALRRSVEAFKRRDLDGALAIYWPDAVWDASPMGAGVFEGRAAIGGLFEDWLGEYEDYDQVIEELRVLGNGVTFSVLHQRGRPQGSSGFVELRYAAVGIWRGGLLKRVSVYTDIDQARAAAEWRAKERG